MVVAASPSLRSPLRCVCGSSGGLYRREPTFRLCGRECIIIPRLLTSYLTKTVGFSTCCSPAVLLAYITFMLCTYIMATVRAASRTLCVHTSRRIVTGSTVRAYGVNALRNGLLPPQSHHSSVMQAANQLRWQQAQKVPCFGDTPSKSVLSNEWFFAGSCSRTVQRGKHELEWTTLHAEIEGLALSSTKKKRVTKMNKHKRRKRRKRDRLKKRSN